MKRRNKKAMAWILTASLLTGITGDCHPGSRTFAGNATPSNGSAPGRETPGPEEEAWLKNIPFYYDENGEKVYDYETFPERYYGIAPAIAGVDDVALLAVVAIGCVLGAFGIHMASEDIGSFLVGSFGPWLEKKHPEKMSDFEIFLAGGAIAISEWVPLLGEFLNGEEVSVKDTGIEYKPNLHTGKPYFSDWDTEIRQYIYTHSYAESDYVKYLDYCILRSEFNTLIGFYIYGEVSNDDGSPLYYKLGFYYVDSTGSLKRNFADSYSNNLHKDGYYLKDHSVFLKGNPTGSTVNPSRIYPDAFGTITVCPVFINAEALRSYYNYGTTGGIVNDQTFGILTTKASLLSSNLKFHESHIYAEKISLPADETSLKSIASSLDSAKTFEEVMEVVDKYWQTSRKKVDLTDAVCYSNLQYIVRVLSRYAGTAITDEQIDSFIGHFYQTYIDGTSALAEKQAAEIIRQFVVINGGQEPPEDDKNKNKYVIVKRLAAALGLFLVSAGLVSDTPVFEGGQTVENIELVDSSSELPAPDPDPPSPNPGIDLSGILDFLQKILHILTAWANPADLIRQMADKLALPGLFESLISAIQDVPQLISGELSLPQLFSDLSAQLLSLPEPLLEPLLGIIQAIWELQSFLAEAIPSPAQIAQAVEDAVIGTDDQNYQLEQSVTDKFPFCVPFDLIHCFQVLTADPVEPVWHVPFLIDHPAFYYQEELVIDLTLFQQPVAVIRFFLLFAFILGLILATRQLIKG